MIESLKDKIIKLLVDTRRIKPNELKKVLEKQKNRERGISKILVSEGLISEKDLMLILSKELNIPPINLSKYKIDPKLAKLVPERIARQFLLVPVSKMKNVLTVAMVDPLNIIAIDEITLLTNYKIDPVIATEADVKEAIDNCYGADSSLAGILDGVKGSDDIEVVEEEGLDMKSLSLESQKAPIVKMADLILNEALARRASDIHIEPCEDFLRIRYRIDGSLREAFKLPKKNQNALTARFKIMSRLDITETRLPQDGRFKIIFEGKEIDFRVSALPIAFGPKIVLRVLDKSNLSVGLEALGFSAASLDIFGKALERPYGMILVTGPTGSGKSTTLYSIINKLNSPDRNIVTLEDPVEYELEGITQVEVKPEIGLTFAGGLRSILRQSPDVIMVGEIRDFETADIAIKASLTGQIILSTLHTNDSVGALTRLVDMKIEPFLLASSLVMAGAQRLLRKICPNCREKADAPKGVLKDLNIDSDDSKKICKGKGCDKCNHTGYYGRFGILEAFLADDHIRDLVIKRASGDEIKEYAVKQGMKTLRQEAVANLVSGTTTVEEVLRVTAEA